MPNTVTSMASAPSATGAIFHWPVWLEVCGATARAHFTDFWNRVEVLEAMASCQVMIAFIYGTLLIMTVTKISQVHIAHKFKILAIEIHERCVEWENGKIWSDKIIPVSGKTKEKLSELYWPISFPRTTYPSGLMCRWSQMPYQPELYPIKKPTCSGRVWNTDVGQRVTLTLLR